MQLSILSVCAVVFGTALAGSHSPAGHVPRAVCSAVPPAAPSYAPAPAPAARDARVAPRESDGSLLDGAASTLGDLSQSAASLHSSSLQGTGQVIGAIFKLPGLFIQMNTQVAPIIKTVQQNTTSDAEIVIPLPSLTDLLQGLADFLGDIQGILTVTINTLPVIEKDIGAAIADIGQTFDLLEAAVGSIVDLAETFLQNCATTFPGGVCAGIVDTVCRIDAIEATLEQLWSEL